MTVPAILTKMEKMKIMNPHDNFDPNEPDYPPDNNENTNVNDYSPPFIKTFGDFQGMDRQEQSIPGLSSLILTLMMIGMAILMIFLFLKEIDDAKYVDVAPVQSSREIE